MRRVKVAEAGVVLADDGDLAFDADVTLGGGFPPASVDPGIDLGDCGFDDVFLVSRESAGLE